MESKKVFVGALYEFGTLARKIVTEDYRDKIPEGAAKPFISYDERTHLFSFTCDRTDTASVSNFYGSVYAYADAFEKKKPEDFLHSSPKLKPMSGTVIEDQLMLEDEEQPGQDLLGVSDDSDSEIGDTAPDPNNPYWTPMIGDSHILSRDIASGVTEATEASLYPEHNRNRVVIMGGDGSDALKRLKNLEFLMNLLAQQRKDGSIKPSNNILMIPSLGDLSTLDFKLVANCPLAIERIVVDQRFHTVLEKKCISQVLYRDGRHGAWLERTNMTEESVKNSVTTSEGFSMIFADQSYPNFGDPQSSKPLEVFTFTNAPAMPPPQKFLGASKAHDISKWTSTIAEGVDPEAIAVEAPIDAGVSEERKRTVRVDSDDEDEDEEEETSAVTPVDRQRRVWIDSEDVADDEQAIAPQPLVTPASRARKMALDSDDEETFCFAPLPPHPQQTWNSISPHVLMNPADIHMAWEHVRPSREIPVPEFQSLDSLDPNGYGKSRGAASASRGMGPPQAVLPPAREFQDVSIASSRDASSFRGRGAGGFHAQTDHHHPNLVQLSIATTSTLENVRPPPGLEIRYNAAQKPLSSMPLVNLLDGDLENIQLPSIKPSTVASEHSQEPQSASTKKSSTLSSGNNGASYVNTYNPPLDMNMLENRQLAKLKQMQEDAREKKRLEKEAKEAENQRTTRPSNWNASRNGTQRMQKDEETASRRFHNTMKQQAPKPGHKSKQETKKMSEKQKAAKLNEILGEPAPAPSAAAFKANISSSETDFEKMSTRKKQALKKNPELDSAAAARLAEKQLSLRQTAKLIEYLNPLFEASRAFKGDLHFEIQLGNVLIADSKDLVTEDGQFFSTKKWEGIFGPPQPAATTFTNILTRNGHDVDRLLKIKPPHGSDGRGPTKLFGEPKPGLTEISYEFHCQSKENDFFWVVMDQTGKYHVRKNTATIGTVNLQYPGSIWDARAVLHGMTGFCEPEDGIAVIVASFMETVYVPAQKKISITYRQPDQNDMVVRSVSVRRTSLLSCYLMDHQDIALQVTEVKDLFHRFHQKDKKLSQSFEKDFQEMFENDRIHYEVSLVHKGMKEVLKQNGTLEIGSLTSEITTGKALLKSQTIQNMLDLTSYVVKKIDWVGVHNNGTLLRNLQEQQNLEARVANTILPGTRPTPSFTNMASTAAGRTIRTDVHGIRINTKAELGMDAGGNPVLIGMGGAMIPLLEVIEEDETNIPESDLEPGDSASNIGIDRKPQHDVPSAAYIRELPPRPKGYW